MLSGGRYNTVLINEYVDVGYNDNNFSVTVIVMMSSVG